MADATHHTNASRMGESVTPHPQMDPLHDARIMACGIDTLDLGIHVNWDNWPNLRDILDTGKGQAKQSREDLAPLHLPVDDLVARPSGRPPNYAFGITSRAYRMDIADMSTPKSGPNVYVSPRAERLWIDGVNAVLGQIVQDIGQLGGEVTAILPSRIDLACDLSLAEPLTEAAIDRHKVTRTRKTVAYKASGDLQTYTTAKGKTPIFLRIYDKSLETKQSRNLWLRHKWADPDAEGVWRFEFQLRRTALNEFRINSETDLETRIAGVWRYLTSNWFSLRELNTVHTSRRNITPGWKRVQEAAELFPGFMQVQRKPPTQTVDETFAIRQGLGIAKTFAARHGLLERDQAIDTFAEELKAATSPYDFTRTVRLRAIRLGVQPTEGGQDDAA